MVTNDIERIRPLVSDLVKIGFFRLSGISMGLSHSELAEIAAEESDFHLVSLGDGWYVTDWEDTLASATLNRIAGIVREPVPMTDVAEALMRAIAYGPASEKTAARRVRARSWKEAYESMPSRAVMLHLCETVGARLFNENGSDRIDFEDVLYPVAPTDKEKSVLYALEESPYGALSVGRLCRRIEGQPSRASTYALIEAMPFILKDHVKAARIIGAEGHPEGYVSGDTEFYRGLSWSACGTRGLIELSANEECIESNSCNIPADARVKIEGCYEEVNSGIEIRCDHRLGPDKRKVGGLTKVIHKLFNDYVSKDKIYLLLDRQTGEARVDVISMHAADKLALIERMLEEGIQKGALAEMLADDIGMAA